MTDEEFDTAVAEYESERAAIYEFDAKLPRGEAEKLAQKDAREFARALSGAT